MASGVWAGVTFQRVNLRGRPWTPLILNRRRSSPYLRRHGPDGDRHVRVSLPTGARWSFGEATTHCDLCSVPRGARERYVKERFWFRCVSTFRMIGVSPSVVPGNAAEPRAGPRACREPSPCYCIAVVVTDDDQDALSPPGAGGGPNAR